MSGFLGLLVGSFGTVLLANIVLNDRAPSDYLAIGGVLSVISSVLIAGIIRVRNRGRRTVLDWDMDTLVARQRFSLSWHSSLHDIQSLIVRCAPVDGKRRRYRAKIELKVMGKQFVVARTAQLKRKAEASRKEAMSLAEPLAAALGVPVHFEEWEDMNTKL